MQPTPPTITNETFFEPPKELLPKEVIQEIGPNADYNLT